MKRYVCAVAAGMLLALAGAGTAAAGLPLPGPVSGVTQSATYGDQSIEKQKNDADVQQDQGNGNVNVSPAISVFGDSSTSNDQGNGNVAVAKVDQSNEATHTESASQTQTNESGGSCCQAESQPADQSSSFGDQYVGEQKNEADVDQAQGNGNVNVSPAVSIFGDSSTYNSQGNGNFAIAKVEQSNQATQMESASQSQSTGSSSCCKGESQPAEQTSDFGDQSIGKQKNEAAVDQYQGNGNVNVSPAVSMFGDSSTYNSQGNGNVAIAKVEQSNEATQSQSASQQQDVIGGGCCEASKGDYGKSGCCEGKSHGPEQSADFGNQSIGKQRNDADIDQYQGNGNVNVSPAFAFSPEKQGGCEKQPYGEDSYAECGAPHAVGGATSSSSQGNGNFAFAGVEQSNSASQSQSAWQDQTVGQCCDEVSRCCQEVVRW